jgi:hypothetical protein
MRTGRVLLGFVLLCGGCGDDSVGATEATLSSSTTTPTTVPMTTSGTTADSPTTGVDPSTSAGPATSTGGSETTADPSTSSGTTMGVDPSTTTTTASTTTGAPETTTSTTTTGEDSSSTGEDSSSGGESSTGEVVVCPPPKPDSLQCEACLETNCCQEYDACFADVKCTCIFNCIFSGQGPMGCAFTCMNMGMQNPTLGAMFICGDECGGCPW